MCYVMACLSKTAIVFYPLILVGHQRLMARSGWRATAWRVWPFVVLAGLCAAGRVIGHELSGQLNYDPFLGSRIHHVLTIFGLVPL